MKRFLIYVLLIAFAVFIPVKGADVARLRPVQVICVSREEGTLLIRTDTGDFGTGATVTEAISTMKATTPAVIYLDTAQYLLIGEDALDTVDDLRKHLKGSLQTCIAEADALQEDTASFLKVHGKLPKLENVKSGSKMPVLIGIEKRLFLSEKNENNA